MRRAVVLAVMGSLAGSLAHAQTSASYQLTESVVNSGGDPRDGSRASSASFHLTLDAIGEAVSGGAPSSASFRVGAGFVGDYPPPGEVGSVVFSDKATLSWSPEPSVGTYAVYRDGLASLPGGFGSCFASGSSSEEAVDPGMPASGQGWYYVVTARNRLGEEGTKGFETTGAERGNAAPCP